MRTVDTAMKSLRISQLHKSNTRSIQNGFWPLPADQFTGNIGQRRIISTRSEIRPDGCMGHPCINCYYEFHPDEDGNSNWYECGHQWTPQCLELQSRFLTRIAAKRLADKQIRLNRVQPKATNAVLISGDQGCATSHQRVKIYAFATSSITRPIKRQRTTPDHVVVLNGLRIPLTQASANPPRTLNPCPTHGWRYPCGARYIHVCPTLNTWDLAAWTTKHELDLFDLTANCTPSLHRWYSPKSRPSIVAIRWAAINTPNDVMPFHWWIIAARDCTTPYRPTQEEFDEELDRRITRVTYDTMKAQPDKRTVMHQCYLKHELNKEFLATTADFLRRKPHTIWPDSLYERLERQFALAPPPDLHPTWREQAAIEEQQEIEYAAYMAAHPEADLLDIELRVRLHPLHVPCLYQIRWNPPVLTRIVTPPSSPRLQHHQVHQFIIKPRLKRTRRIARSGRSGIKYKPLPPNSSHCDTGHRCNSTATLPAWLMDTAAGALLVNNTYGLTGIHTLADPVEVSGVTGDSIIVTQAGYLDGVLALYSQDASACCFPCATLVDANWTVQYVQRTDSYVVVSPSGHRLHYQRMRTADGTVSSHYICHPSLCFDGPSSSRGTPRQSRGPSWPPAAAPAPRAPRSHVALAPTLPVPPPNAILMLSTNATVGLSTPITPTAQPSPHNASTGPWSTDATTLTDADVATDYTSDLSIDAAAEALLGVIERMRVPIEHRGWLPLKTDAEYAAEDNANTFTGMALARAASLAWWRDEHRKSLNKVLRSVIAGVVLVPPPLPVKTVRAHAPLIGQPRTGPRAPILLHLDISLLLGQLYVIGSFAPSQYTIVAPIDDQQSPTILTAVELIIEAARTQDLIISEIRSDIAPDTLMDMYCNDHGISIDYAGTAMDARAVHTAVAQLAEQVVPTHLTRALAQHLVQAAVDTYNRRPMFPPNVFPEHNNMSPLHLWTRSLPSVILPPRHSFGTLTKYRPARAHFPPAAYKDPLMVIAPYHLGPHNCLNHNITLAHFCLTYNVTTSQIVTHDQAHLRAIPWSDSHNAAISHAGLRDDKGIRLPRASTPAHNQPPLVAMFTTKPTPLPRNICTSPHRVRPDTDAAIIAYAARDATRTAIWTVAAAATTPALLPPRLVAAGTPAFPLHTHWAPDPHTSTRTRHPDHVPYSADEVCTLIPAPSSRATETSITTSPHARPTRIVAAGIPARPLHTNWILDPGAGTISRHSDDIPVRPYLQCPPHRLPTPGYPTLPPVVYGIMETHSAWQAHAHTHTMPFSDSLNASEAPFPPHQPWLVNTGAPPTPTTIALYNPSAGAYGLPYSTMPDAGWDAEYERAPLPPYSDTTVSGDYPCQ